MGYFVLAALSLAISGLLWFASQRKALVAEHRAIRNHLIEFMRVWFVLSAYYLFQPLVKLLPAAVEPRGIICLVRYLPPLFLWHFCVALILGFANIWLRRAGLELEISELPQNKDRLVLPLETLGSAWQRFLKWCTEEGILWGFLVALLPLAFMPSLASSRVTLSIAYSVQLLATSLLFVRLGFAYKNVLGSRLLFGLSIGYAIVQLPYGILVPAGTFSVYELPLGLFKVIHGFTLAVICLSYARRQIPQEERPTAESLARLAKRLQGRATLRGIQQFMIFGALAMLALLVLAGLYSCAVTALRSLGSTELQLVPIRLVFCLMLLLAWQVCGYLVLAKLRFRVNWADHKELLQHFKISVQEPDAGVPGIELVSIELADITANPDQQQVVLLHGLFSSGAAAWGLLPLVLLRDGRVTCVRSLTYSHGLLTRRRELDQIAKDLSTRIGSLIADFPGKTLIIGHSLGGVIVLKVLPELIRSRSGTGRGLHHVGIVGAPLLGSSFAKALFPWPWSRMLGPRSRLLEETLREALSVVPPVGSATDGEILIPGLTFVYGSRDSVAGELVQFAAFHGEKIRAPAFHGLGLVFFETQELARVYRRMLSAAPRAVALARAVGDGILATEQFNANGVFIFIEEMCLASSQLVGSLRGERLLGHTVMAEELVEQRLKKLYERYRERAIPWETYWQDLEKEVERSSAPTFFLKIWPDDHVLFLYFNRFTGFFALMPGAGRWLGEQTKDAHASTSLGPVSSAIMTAFRNLDPAAVSAVLVESCNHLTLIQERSLSVTGANFTTAVDSDGTYYGLYAFDGIVKNNEGIDQIYLHIGAPGQPLSLGELAFSCHDEVRNLALSTELVELGKNCWLCRVNLGSRRGGGEEVRLRLSFRRQNCVSLLHGFELFRLEPVLSAGARVSVRLLLPGRGFALDAFKVKNGRLEAITPHLSEESLERRYSYSLETEVEVGDEAIGFRFMIDPVATERRRLRDMITVDRARAEDLPKIAGMESLLSVRVAAKLDDLFNRFVAFPDGMLVARVGDSVVGYVEFVRWNRERPTKFLDVSPIHAQHEVDGRSAFIWFLGVLPAFRGRGIGRRLVSEVASWSEKRGIRQLQIVTQSGLREYFEDIGFKRIADLDEYMPSMTGVFMARGVVL
jgi:ribosomal protein S18 acetylase RimI-like enzyme/pimeloyl-ACP methyl ester carboxylesterase